MNWFWIVAAVVGFLISLVVHEVAHALALRSNGIDIKQAGLGLPVKPMYTIPAKGRRPILTLSPWVIIAYVMPHERDMPRVEALSYRESAWYAGAGVVANLMIGVVLTALSWAMAGHLVVPLVLLGVLALVWLGRKVLTGYVFPVIALPLLVFVLWATIQALLRHEATGPVGTALFLATAVSLPSLVNLLAGINLALAILNVIPIYPLDGGRIADAVIGRAMGATGVKIFRMGTGVVTAVLFLVSFVGDALHFL